MSKSRSWPSLVKKAPLVAVSRIWVRRRLTSSRLQPLWEALLRVCLRLMNIGGGAGPRHSGESWLVGEIVPNGGVIIDVGANEGQYAEEVLNAMPDARLYCLEPSPEAFSALSSRLANRPVQIFNVGLSSRAGELNLYGEPGSPLGSVYQRRLDHFGLSSYHSVSVQVLPLDAFWSGQTGTVIDLLKLDAEGHELQILQGAKRLLAGRMIRAIQFEFGGANIDYRTFFQEIIGTS